MGTPQHPFVTETGQPGRRRKSRLACNPCRARKTGCDGRKPVCTACSLRGWEDKCAYPDSVMQPSAALTMVELDRRIQKLESESRADSDTPRSAGTDVAPPLASASTASATQDKETEPSDAAALDNFASHNPVSSTNAAFMRQGLEAAGQRRSQEPFSSESPMSVPDSPDFPDLIGFSTQIADHPLDEIDPHAMALPQRQFADEMLRWYWQNFHSVFPFLHWPTFQNTARSLWKQKGRPRQGFDTLLSYAKLNMVLALACFRNEAMQLEQRQYHADEFYKRSLRLVSAETLDTASIPVVQLLLLRTLYLYFAGRADRCWLMSGAAIRVAIGLGLHVTPKRELNQLEREMRRRVWYGGCIALDQILASTFGRPAMIYPGLTQVPPPLAVDEEYLATNGEGHQPEGIPSLMDLTLYSSRIMEVLSEMRAAAREPQLKLKTSGAEFTVPDPTALLRVNSRIDDLFDGLPPHLRQDADFSNIPIDEDRIKCFRTQSDAIRFRLLLLRVFLLRPSLLAEAQRWTTRNPTAPQTASLMLQERFHQEICNLCLTTVHTIVEEIHHSLVTQGGISAWYALHFTFAAATVLLVATLSPILCVSLDVEPAKSTWDRAMAILDFYKVHVSSAARGMEVLQRYRESIRLRAGAVSGMATSSQALPNIPFQSSPPHQQQGYAPQQGHQLLQAQQGHPPHQIHQNQLGTHYGAQPQQWVPTTQAMPTPPMVPTGLMEGLEGFLGSDSLETAWLTTQDYGRGDWMLHGI